MAIPEWFKDIPEFSGWLDCLKCGSAPMRPKFHTPIMPDDPPECLFWTCQSCGASRYTKCKDAN